MDTVSQVAKLHEDLLKDYPGHLTVIKVITAQAQTLFDEHRQSNPAVCHQISNWLPKYVGVDHKDILAADISLEDMRLAVSREHGFDSWQSAVEFGKKRLNPNFEDAITAITTGSINDLQLLITKLPYLVSLRSPYGHQSTLLHYVAANGVETWRQQVPENAAEITKLLLDNGADVHARAFVYGGEFDTLALLMSSAHPAEAGVTDAVAALLREAGAAG